MVGFSDIICSDAGTNILDFMDYNKIPTLLNVTTTIREKLFYEFSMRLTIGRSLSGYVGIDLYYHAVLYAIYRNNIRATPELDVEFTSDNVIYYMRAAIRRGNYYVIQEIIAQHPNEINNFGQEISYACKLPQKQAKLTIMLLQSFGIQPDVYCIVEALRLSDIKLAKWLVKNGCPIPSASDYFVHTIFDTHRQDVLLYALDQLKIEIDGGVLEHLLYDKYIPMLQIALPYLKRPMWIISLAYISYQLNNLNRSEEYIKVYRWAIDNNMAANFNYEIQRRHIHSTIVRVYKLKKVVCWCKEYNTPKKITMQIINESTRCQHERKRLKKIINS